MKEPSKEEMLECFDDMCQFLAKHHFTERDERAVAIYKLIEDAYTIPDTSEREAEPEQIIIKMQEELDKKGKEEMIPSPDKKYQIIGTFSILFPLDGHKETYEEINFLNDIIRIALEKDCIEVKRISVQIIKVEK